MSQSSTRASPHVLIVGSGSVGKRHAENLYNLDCAVSCVDPRSDRQQELASTTPIRGAYRSIEDAISLQCQYDGVVICSPPKWHVEQATYALSKNISVLLEKPVGKDLTTALVLKNVVEEITSDTGPQLLLGYTWRWWTALRYLRKMVNDGSIGHVFFTRIHVSANLEDWHPWERYQNFFMSSSELGGGALLDESHWLDQMIWLFGMPDRVFGTVAKISDLEITSDDSVDLLCFYRNGMNVSIHMVMVEDDSSSFLGWSIP